MSPHAVNNFVSDLVLMAQAMEKLPIVEHELSAAKSTINSLEQRLIDRASDMDQAKIYAAQLEQKVHDLEVAKDAAETMFLEADDRTARALDFVKATFGNAGSLIQALEPPKAVEPQPVPEGLHSEPIPQVVDTRPIMSDDEHEAVLKQSREQGQSEADPIPLYDDPQDQSAADPTASVDHTSMSPDAFTTTSAPETNSAITDASPPSWASPTPPDTKPKPYAGMKYSDWPKYVSYHDWIDGGGTEHSYYF
jgi:hypothetical protein